jgi:hypothetical protein
MSCSSLPWPSFPWGAIEAQLVGDAQVASQAIASRRGGGQVRVRAAAHRVGHARPSSTISAADRAKDELRPVHVFRRPRGRTAAVFVQQRQQRLRTKFKKRRQRGGAYSPSILYDRMGFVRLTWRGRNRTWAKA